MSDQPSVDDTRDLLAEVDRLTRALEDERQIATNDPAEQRAERYALEAADLTRRLMAAEKALEEAQQERDMLADRHGTLQGVAVLRLQRAEQAEADAARARAALEQVSKLPRYTEVEVQRYPSTYEWVNADELETALTGQARQTTTGEQP